MSSTSKFAAACLMITSFAGCGGNAAVYPPAKDPSTAPVANIDRFQDSFATLFKRSAPAFNPNAVSAVIPAPNAPIVLDNFLVKSFGPNGEIVTYYSLDIVAPTPQTAYRIIGSDGNSIAGQLPVFAGVPGDANYSDFARITTVQVSDGYVVNSIASASDVAAAISDGAKATLTEQVVNWSLVPAGTTLKLKFLGKDPSGHQGWVNGEIVDYLEFETDLSATAAGTVPTVPIIVIFANDMSPAGGFAEDGNGMTHNVVGLLPGQSGYSSYWDHSVGNLSGFASVHDLASAEVNVKAKAPVIVNCPVVAP